jgi:hypothetical protein
MHLHVTRRSQQKPLLHKGLSGDGGVRSYVAIPFGCGGGLRGVLLQPAV